MHLNWWHLNDLEQYDGDDGYDYPYELGGLNGQNITGPEGIPPENTPSGETKIPNALQNPYYGVEPEDNNEERNTDGRSANFRNAVNVTVVENPYYA